MVIKPLYNEEIHILTRKDSPIKSFSDLKGKKIFAGNRRWNAHDNNVNI